MKIRSFKKHEKIRGLAQTVVYPSVPIRKTNFLHTFWGKVAGAAILTAIASAGFFIRKKIETKEKMKLNQQAHENTMREIDEKDTKAKELEKYKHDLKEKEAERRKAEREAKEKRSEQSCSTEKMTETESVDVFRTFSQIMNTPAKDLSSLRLMYPFLHIGVDLGVVGENNCGKTSLVNQILFSLANGHSIENLWPDIQPSTPMRVLMFTTEQNEDDIRTLYKSIADEQNRDNLIVITEEFVSPESIVNGIEKYVENSTDPRGLVVSIDNYSKLVEKYGPKVIKGLNKRLDDLKSKYAKTHPLTLIKVYHTQEKYNPYRPLTLSDVRAFQDSTNTTKNFIGLASCNEGETARILYVLKNKLEPSVMGSYVIRYAGTKAPFYTFNRKVDDVNTVLPIRTPLSQRKVGRPQEHTDEEIMEIYRIKQETGRTWEDLENEYHISRNGVKKRRKKILAKSRGE